MTNEMEGTRQGLWTSFRKNGHKRWEGRYNKDGEKEEKEGKDENLQSCKTGFR